MFRWIALIALVAAISVSASFRRRARQEGGTIPRRREDPWLIAGRLLVALPLFVGILAYLVYPPSMTWATFSVSYWLRWVGAALALGTVPMVYWVLSSLGRNVSETVLTKTDHELVTHGPYRWIRHPLYGVGVALILGIGLMAANWFILLFGAATLLLVRLVVIPAEERMLVATFGDEYRRYMERTGGLVPRIVRR